MLLEESVKDFIYECEVNKFTWKTIKGYRNGLEYLVNYLRQEHNLRYIEEVQTRHLKAYFMWQSKKGRKESANCKCKLDTLGRMSGGYLGNVNIVQECLK